MNPWIEETAHLYESKALDLIFDQLAMWDKMNSDLIINELLLIGHSNTTGRSLFAVKNAKGDVIGYWKVYEKTKS